MEWYWILLICLGGGYLVFCFFASIVMFRFSTRPKKFTDDVLFERDRDIFNYDGTNYKSLPKTKFELDCGDALIKGEILFAKEKTNKVAIISHGFTASRVCAAKYGEIFYGIGYNIVTYDQRYFGESGGKCCTMGYRESEDLLKVIEYVKTVFDNPKIVLHGESMGAATVLLALAKTKDVCYAVADCSFSDNVELYRHVTRHVTHFSSFPITDLACIWNRIDNGFWSYKINPIDAVAATETPIMFIHGKADGFIPCYMSEKMFKAAKNKLSELHIVPNARHAMSFSTDSEKYKEFIINFDNKINNTEEHNESI